MYATRLINEIYHLVQRGGQHTLCGLKVSRVTAVRNPNGLHMLAMSGDAIYMDYYSRLGPIDPQVENQRGRQVPALGYLEKYNELIAKAQNPGAITLAEIQILLNFDQAELHQYEQAQELSVALQLGVIMICFLIL